MCPLHFIINFNYLNYFLILFLIKIISENFSLFELFSKVSQNNFFSDFFLIFWTNSWLINIFFAIFFFNAYFLIKNNYITLNGVKLLIISFLINEIMSFFLDSLFINCLNNLFLNVNALLINNLNKIHPPVLYYAAANTTVLYFYFIKTLWNYSKFSITLISKKIYFKITLIFNLVTTAIFLGSWWAVQEQSWNGWWNWDSSEVLSLGPLVLLVILLHTKKSFAGVIKLKKLIKYMFFFNFMFFIAVQLNFEQTNHNFGIKFFFFFNNLYFLMFSLTLTLKLSFYFFIKNLINFNTLYFIYRNYRREIELIFFFNTTATLLFLFSIKICAISVIMSYNLKSWLIFFATIGYAGAYFFLENLVLSIIIIFLFNYFFNSIKSRTTVALIIHFLIINFLITTSFDCENEVYSKTKQFFNESTLQAINKNLYYTNFYQAQQTLNERAAIILQIKFVEITTSSTNSSTELPPFFLQLVYGSVLTVLIASGGFEFTELKLLLSVALTFLFFFFKSSKFFTIIYYIK